MQAVIYGMSYVKTEMDQHAICCHTSIFIQLGDAKHLLLTTSQAWSLGDNEVCP